MSARDEAAGGAAEVKLPCPSCDSRIWTVGAYSKTDKTIRVTCCVCGMSGPLGAWNRRTPSPRDQACSALLGALERYRYAAAWNGADSWDACGECVDRLRWASEMDGKRLDNNQVAKLGQEYLAARSAGIEPLALPVGGKVMT